VNAHACVQIAPLVTLVGAKHEFGILNGNRPVIHLMNIVIIVAIW